jgi:hypothetical protein
MSANVVNVTAAEEEEYARAEAWAAEAAVTAAAVSIVMDDEYDDEVTADEDA